MAWTREDLINAGSTGYTEQQIQWILALPDDNARWAALQQFQNENLWNYKAAGFTDDQIQWLANLPDDSTRWQYMSQFQQQNAGPGALPPGPTFPTFPGGGPLPSQQPGPTPFDQEFANKNAFAYVQGLLSDYDLGSLADWAWEQIVDGNSPEMVMQQLRNRSEFKNRFKGMAIRDEKGLPAISPAEYIQYERQAYQLMRAANLPAGFYDERDDFAELIGKDVSPSELNQRIQNGYLKVTQAPDSVRAQFADWFGRSGDSALAAYFMDPDRALPLLERQAAMAEFGGYGRNFGFNVNINYAEEAARRGIDAGTAQQGFASLAGEASYYNETISENTDLVAEREGIASTFAFDSTSAGLVRGRKERRAAEFGGSAPALLTSQGAIGLGSSST